MVRKTMSVGSSPTPACGAEWKPLTLETLRRLATEPVRHLHRPLIVVVDERLPSDRFEFGPWWAKPWWWFLDRVSGW